MLVLTVEHNSRPMTILQVSVVLELYALVVATSDRVLTWQIDFGLMGDLSTLKRWKYTKLIFFCLKLMIGNNQCY